MKDFHTDEGHAPAGKRSFTPAITTSRETTQDRVWALMPKESAKETIQRVKRNAKPLKKKLSASKPKAVQASTASKPAAVQRKSKAPAPRPDRNAQTLQKLRKYLHIDG